MDDAQKSSTKNVHAALLYNLGIRSNLILLNYLVEYIIRFSLHEITTTAIHGGAIKNFFLNREISKGACIISNTLLLAKLCLKC